MKGRLKRIVIPSSKSFVAKTPRPCTFDFRISTSISFVISAKYFSSSVYMFCVRRDKER